MSNVPEIRFKGYTDAWVQRKLGTTVDRVCVGFVGTLEKDYTDSSGIPLYRTGNLSGLTLNNDNLKYVTREFHEKNQKSQLKHGDILIARHGENGKAIVYTLNEDANCLNIVIIRPGNSEINSAFLANYINSPVINKKIQGLSAGSTQNVINTKEIEKLDLLIPKIKSEQDKIAKFIQKLDNTITLHKRKLEGLKVLKQAYLQRMFPQNGESVPRLRFVGFVGDWETKMLKEISNKVTEKNSEKEFTETLTNSAEYGIINQREFFDKDISNEKNLGGYFVVRPDDFVYNPRISNHAPVGPIKRNLLGRTGVMSPLYYVFRVAAGNLTFIEKYFESVYWHEFMKLNGDNGVRADRFNIKDSVFEEMPIPFPSLSEQKAIGELFHNLDNQIIAQQIKLNNLKQLKSAYLQKMFV